MVNSKETKDRFSITIDKKINKLLEGIMEKNLSFNKSKLIEKLIIKYIESNKK